jgi:hypothetical protein
MKYSEITLREAIKMTEVFCPIKIVYNDIELYNDYDSDKVIEDEIYGERLPPAFVIPMRMEGLEDRIVSDIHIEFVDFHHSIVTIKGEWVCMSIPSVYEFAKNRWAVVGFDYNTAKQIMADIEESSGKEIFRRVRTKNQMFTELTDGTVLRWINDSSSLSGQKFGKLWCTKALGEDVLTYMVLPRYFGKIEDIIWL